MKRAGIVLCGGRSQRMGRPKALLPWFGRTMIEHVVGLLSARVDEILVVTSSALTLPASLAARVVVDREPERGPLAALRDGLAAARAERAFVTSSDAPFLTSDHVDALFAEAEAHGRAAAVRADGFLQALLAVDIDHDAAQSRRAAVGTVDGGAECVHPVTLLGVPRHPVLDVEIAPGIDRFLDRFRGAIAILRIEPRNEQVVVDRLVRGEPEQPSRGVRPVQLPGREFEIPGTDARSFGAAPYVVVERILAAKRSIDVNHTPASSSSGEGYHAGRCFRQRGAANPSDAAYPI